MTKGNLNNFLSDIRTFLDKDAIYTDDLRRMAWGTDAGFYRLVPKIVIITDNENEVSRLLQISAKYKVPVTFRAAGTSLSGQSVSDSVLIVAGKNWDDFSISADGTRIVLQKHQ